MKNYIIIILILILSSSVYSISLTPVRASLILDGDNEGEIILNVGNTNSDQVKILTNSKYIFPEKEFFDVINGQARPVIKYKFDYSEMKPGKHRILISAQPTSFSGAAAAAVGFTFNVYKPMDDHYSEVKIAESRYDLKSFEGLKFTLENWANLTVDDLMLEFNLNDNNSFSNNYSFGPFVLEPLEKKGITVPIGDQLSPGIYFVKGKIKYEGKEFDFDNKVFMGDVNININNFSNEFFAGRVNNLELGIYSTWLNKFEKVDANYVLKKDGKIVAQTKSPTIELLGWRQNIITGFLDLTDVESGEYYLDVTLNYQSQGEVGETTKSFDIVVKNENKLLNFVLDNYIILLVVLLFVLFLLFLRYRKRVTPSSAQLNLKHSVAKNSNTVFNRSQNYNNTISNNARNNYANQYYARQAYNQNYYNQYYQNYYNQYQRGKNDENNK